MHNYQINVLMGSTSPSTTYLLETKQVEVEFSCIQRRYIITCELSGSTTNYSHVQYIGLMVIIFLMMVHMYLLGITTRESTINTSKSIIL